jgi:chromosome segregation ATPase
MFNRKKDPVVELESEITLWAKRLGRLTQERDVAQDALDKIVVEHRNLLVSGDDSAALAKASGSRQGTERKLRDLDEALSIVRNRVAELEITLAEARAEAERNLQAATLEALADKTDDLASQINEATKPLARLLAELLNTLPNDLQLRTPHATLNSLGIARLMIANALANHVPDVFETVTDELGSSAVLRRGFSHDGHQVLFVTRSPEVRAQCWTAIEMTQIAITAGLRSRACSLRSGTERSLVEHSYSKDATS